MSNHSNKKLRPTYFCFDTVTKERRPARREEVVKLRAKGQKEKGSFEGAMWAFIQLLCLSSLLKIRADKICAGPPAKVTNTLAFNRRIKVTGARGGLEVADSNGWETLWLCFVGYASAAFKSAAEGAVGELLSHILGLAARAGYQDPKCQFQVTRETNPGWSQRLISYLAPPVWVSVLWLIFNVDDNTNICVSGSLFLY